MKEPAMDWMFVSSHRLYVEISSSMLLTTGVGTSGGNCIMCWSVFISTLIRLLKTQGRPTFSFDYVSRQHDDVYERGRVAVIRPGSVAVIWFWDLLKRNIYLLFKTLI